MKRKNYKPFEEGRYVRIEFIDDKSNDKLIGKGNFSNMGSAMDYLEFVESCRSRSPKLTKQISRLWYIGDIMEDEYEVFRLKMQMCKQIYEKNKEYHNGYKEMHISIKGTFRGRTDEIEILEAIYESGIHPYEIIIKAVGK